MIAFLFIHVENARSIERTLEVNENLLSELCALEFQFACAKQKRSLTVSTINFP